MEDVKAMEIILETKLNVKNSAKFNLFLNLSVKSLLYNLLLFLSLKILPLIT